MACSSSCPAPGTHASMGECIRSKGVKVAYANSAKNMDYTQQKRWDRDLDAYRDARKAGIQPTSTRRSDVDAALRASDSTGSAFRADA